MCLAFDRFMKRNFFISLNWQMNTLQIGNIKGLFSIDRDILVIPTEFCLTEHNILSLNKYKTEIIQIKWHEEMLAPWLINGFKPLQKKKTRCLFNFIGNMKFWTWKKCSSVTFFWHLHSRIEFYCTSHEQLHTLQKPSFNAYHEVQTTKNVAVMTKYGKFNKCTHALKWQTWTTTTKQHSLTLYIS